VDERWTDLISYLRERFSPETKVEEMETFLSSAGYDRQQIGEILSAFYSEIPVRATGTLPVVSHSMTFRVMGPHERGRFAPEAWGHLLSLNGSGVLSGAELEHVIERALAQFDGRIALDDLRALIEGSSYDDPGSATDHVTVH
jgi:Smg protein